MGIRPSEDLRRSEEILTGAIPSAKDGTRCGDHVARGDAAGIWDIVKKALEPPEEHKHPDDWRVVFFPWQDDPAYCDAEPASLTEETVRYFVDKPGFSDRPEVLVSTDARSVRTVHHARVSHRARGMFPDADRGCDLRGDHRPAARRGAIRSAAVDNSALVHTAWDLGAH